MAELIPFRALRPAPSVASRVASVPYDVVSTEEARALAATEPLSFLHVTRSEIDLPDTVSPYDQAVYARAAENLKGLQDNAPLLQDGQPGLYFYRLRMGGHEQTGLAGCFSVDEYERDIIRKHEKTRPDKEDDRTRHIVALRAQTGVVFLTYRESPVVNAVADRTCAGTPMYHFTAADGVEHSVWPVGAMDVRALIQAFDAIPVLYIADGHHRAASAARARTALRDQGQHGESDAFIAVAVPDAQVRMLPYHRVVKDLNGLTPASFLETLGTRVRVSPGAGDGRRDDAVSMFLDGRWYALELPVTPDGTSRADALAVAVLQREVLEPVLGIGDPRTDKRIDFVGGIHGPGRLEALVAGGQAAVAFAMPAVTVDDLMAIADTGGIMPPKSTWFEPKLRDGLLVHLV